MWYKKGIVNNSGVTVESYQMRDKAIPTNAFCMKADVASSEGANNMELAILYNSACVYKTPAQLEDSRVRHGIDGFPIVIFCSRSFSSWWTPGQRICSRRLSGQGLKRGMREKMAVEFRSQKPILFIRNNYFCN